MSNAEALVIAVEKTLNQKTGPVSVTHVAQDACPSSCPFIKSGCYAEQGIQGMHTRRLNRAARRARELGAELDRRDLAREEARAILSRLSGKRDLRLHVVGDCATPSAAEVIGRAVDAYRAKYGRRVWTYTHAWRDVPRAAWRGTSVLASVESIGAAKDALAAGYAPALVVSKFGTDKATVIDGVRVIPCPAQTQQDVQCVDCRLCWDADALQNRGACIAFEAHGSGAKGIREALGE